MSEYLSTEDWLFRLNPNPCASILTLKWNYKMDLRLLVPNIYKDVSITELLWIKSNCYNSWQVPLPQFTWYTSITEYTQRLYKQYIQYNDHLIYIVHSLHQGLFILARGLFPTEFSWIYAIFFCNITRVGGEEALKPINIGFIILQHSEHTVSTSWNLVQPGYILCSVSGYTLSIPGTKKKEEDRGFCILGL